MYMHVNFFISTTSPIQFIITIWSYTHRPMFYHSTVIDNVTNYVTHRIFNTNWYSDASLKLKLALLTGFQHDIMIIQTWLTVCWLPCWSINRNEIINLCRLFRDLHRESSLKQCTCNVCNCDIVRIPYRYAIYILRNGANSYKAARSTISPTCRNAMRFVHEILRLI